MKLRCWCCGQELGNSFALVTFTAEPQAVDMVYLALPQHAKQAQDVRTLRVMVLQDLGPMGRKIPDAKPKGALYRRPGGKWVVKL